LGVRGLSTAAEIFADEGKLGFLMTLSSAAMRLRNTDTDRADHVNTVEVVKGGVNTPTVAYQSDAWAVAAAHLTMLDADDMPSLRPVASGDKNFPATGLESGIFTSMNGAALVARSDDALFIAFRGSNDVDGGIGWSPDSSQWGPKRTEHYKLFAELNAAVAAYAEVHPEITKVYVTGHSLGGGMVNAFMQSHPGDLYEAVSFGSIRYGNGTSRADSRVTNVWNDGDVALLLGGRADGDNIRFKLAGPDVVSQHMPWLYQAEIKFVSDLGYGIDDLSGYNRVVLGAVSTGLFSSGIGIGADSLAGTSGRDLILGGAGSDRMQGWGGRDRIDGGSGSRDAAVYTEKAAGIAVDLNGSNFVDVVVGGRTEDRIRRIEDIAGGSGDDTIVGDSHPNRLAGNGGADRIVGGRGNDRLWGGAGQDTLTGGSNKDAFVFNVRPGQANADHVTDFTPGVDHIELDDAIYEAIGGRVQAREFYSAWRSGGIAHDRDDRLIYDERNGALFYDADGSKQSYDPHLIAILEGKPVLHHADILIA